MSTIERVLVVGLGSIGRRHARVATEVIPGVRIAALRSSRGELSNDVPVETQVTTIEEALAFQPQAAVIATPSAFHVACARRLAMAGIHVLVEKPIADSLNGVDDLIATCRDRRVVLMTGYNLRFSPALQHFRELVVANDVGRILSVRAEVGQHLASWRPGTDYRRGVSARAELGGGALLELSHEIDYLRWVFGEIESVSATVRRLSDLDIDVEDTACLVLEFASESRRRGSVAMLTLDFTRHDATRTCTAIGEHGTLRLDVVAGQVTRFRAECGAWEIVSSHAVDRDTTYRAEWRHFLHCIETGESPLVSGEDGLAALRVVAAARESSSRRAVVSIDSPC